jgi:hypothetical protein
MDLWQKCCIGIIVGMFGADIGLGSTVEIPSQVLGHNYQPPYTTQSCNKDGGCTTTHHPDKYYVVYDCGGKNHRSDSRHWYYRLKKGQPVRLRVRGGKWTHIHWSHNPVVTAAW